MRIKILTPILIYLLGFSTAAVSADIQAEISHLLDFVKNTQCQYERNGTSHTGVEAVKHIQNKYDYFKDEIDNTEKFIELSATKSTLSGKYYMIQCDGSPKLKSQQWLLQELKNFREESNSKISFAL